MLQMGATGRGWPIVCISLPRLLLLLLLLLQDVRVGVKAFMAACWVASPGSPAAAAANGRGQRARVCCLARAAPLVMLMGIACPSLKAPSWHLVQHQALLQLS